MRQLIVQAPRGKGGEVTRLACAQNGSNIACFPAVGPDGPQSGERIRVKLLKTLRARLQAAHPNLTPLLDLWLVGP